MRADAVGARGLEAFAARHAAGFVPDEALEGLRLPDVIKIRLAAHRERPGVVEIGPEGTTVTTFGQLLDGAEEWAASLRGLGVEPGDRVILCAGNGASWLRGFLAIHWCRCTVVPLDPTLDAQGLGVLAQQADARAALTNASLEPRLPQGLPCLDLKSDLAALRPGVPLRPRSSSQGPCESSEETAVILFTSGTTGLSKGAMLSHHGVLLRTFRGLRRLDVRAPTRLLSIVPMNHIYGLIISVTACLTSGTTVIVPTELSPAVLERAFHEGQPVWFPAVPRVFLGLRDKVERAVAARGLFARGGYRLLLATSRFARKWLGLQLGPFLLEAVHREFGGALRHCVSAGAELPADLSEYFLDLGCGILDCYGLTESSGGFVMSSPTLVIPGSPGFPMDGEETRILSPDSSGRGELAMRSGAAFPGYFREPEATRQAFCDGWLRTGDLASIDRTGAVRIHGRIKEMIVLPNGKKVSPDEIDGRFRNLEGVQELAAFAVPAAGGSGDEVHLAVVPVCRDALSAAALQRRLVAFGQTLPPSLRVHAFHLVEALPKTAVGKARRLELRAQLRAGALVELERLGEASGERGQPPVADTDGEATLAAVLEAIATIAPPERAGAVKPDASLSYDVGLDSLAMLDLAAALGERFGVNLASELAVAASPRHVALAVERALAKRGARPEAPPVVVAATEIAEPPKPSGWLYSLLGRLARLTWHLEAHGLERLPRDGAFVLCPNHESHLDALWVSSALPREQRARMCMLAKREHFENRLRGRLIRALGGVPVDREGDPSRSLAQCERALQAGRILLLHPEGTRTRNGQPQPLRRGAIILARRTGVPLIQVNIEGAFETFPRHARLPSLFDFRRGGRRRLTITFGEPLDPGAYAQDDGERRLVADLEKGMFRAA